MTATAMPAEGDKQDLTDLQLAIMRVLWSGGEATVAEVVKALAGERPLAHTTVSTVLSRLEKRGVVECDRAGRQLVYTARVGRPEARKALVSSLIERVFGGDPAALVSHLLTEHGMREEDVREMGRLVRKGREK